MKKAKLPLMILIAIFLGAGSYLLSSKYHASNNKLQANKPKEEVVSHKFQDFYKNKLEDVHKLRISNSSDGVTLETTDKEKIKEFFELVNGTTFLLDDDQEEKEGITYYVDLVENEEGNKWFRINFPRAKFITYSPDKNLEASEYYNMEKTDEVMKKIEEMYNSLKVK